MPGFPKKIVLDKISQKQNQYGAVLRSLEDEHDIGSIFDLEIFCNEKIHYFKILYQLFDSTDSDIIQLSVGDYIKIFN